jgi:lipoprotein-releasing system permease protein
MGVAVGVMAMVVVLSVMDGFERELKARLFRSDVHILLTHEKGFFKNPSELSEKIYGAHDSVAAIHPIIQNESMLRLDERTEGVVIQGVQDPKWQQITKKLLVEGSRGQRPVGRGVADSPIYLGRDLAYSLAALPGEEILVVSPTETQGPFESIPRVKKFYLAGFVNTENAEKDRQWAWTPARHLRSFLRLKEGVNRLEIEINEPSLSGQVASAIRALLPEAFHVEDWKSLNAHLFASLKLERWAMFIILLFTVLVASFGIVTSMTLSVHEKHREIAILKAMGAHRRMVGRIFLYQGIWIGALGVCIGLLLGLISCVILQRTDVIQLPDIYYDRTLPVKITPIYLFWIAGAAFLVTLLGSFFPARKASSYEPVRALKGLPPA